MTNKYALNHLKLKWNLRDIWVPIPQTVPYFNCSFSLNDQSLVPMNWIGQFFNVWLKASYNYRRFQEKETWNAAFLDAAYNDHVSSVLILVLLFPRML